MTELVPLDTDRPRPASARLLTPTDNVDVIWQRPHSADGQIHYRVEERRRTLFVTSSIPPEEWDDRTRRKISVELSEVPEEVSPHDPSCCRRAHSCSSESHPTIKCAEEEPQATGAGVRSFSSTPFAPSKQALAVSLAPGRGSPMFFSSTEKLKKPLSPFRSAFPRRRIYFYNREDPHYGFTNFSSHPVEYKGRIYPTSEHLFQSFKFQEHRPLLAEHIRLFSDRPSVALSEARRFHPEVRPDWKNINVEMMDVALWHKFNQHPDLKQELLSTGNAELIEDSDKDSFWGVGANRQGQNELGKALERLRARFRAQLT